MNNDPHRVDQGAAGAVGSIQQNKSTSPSPIFQLRSTVSSTTGSNDGGAPRPSTLLDWALAYASYGLRVFPLHSVREGQCSCGSNCGKNAAKHPRVNGGFKVATTDTEQIKAWWSKWPTANIGISTGRASRLVVFDIDGTQGLTTLRTLTTRNGSLPRTPTVKTARGWHIWFRYPESALAISCSASDGLDVRGDGGYCVAPPSVHAAGHVYQWCEADDVG